MTRDSTMLAVLQSTSYLHPRSRTPHLQRSSVKARKMRVAHHCTSGAMVISLREASPCRLGAAAILFANFGGRDPNRVYSSSRLRRGWYIARSPNNSTQLRRCGTQRTSQIVLFVPLTLVFCATSQCQHPPRTEPRRSARPRHPCRPSSCRSSTTEATHYW